MRNPFDQFDEPVATPENARASRPDVFGVSGNGNQWSLDSREAISPSLHPPNPFDQFDEEPPGRESPPAPESDRRPQDPWSRDATLPQGLVPADKFFDPERVMIPVGLDTDPKESAPAEQAPDLPSSAFSRRDRIGKPPLTTVLAHDPDPRARQALDERQIAAGRAVNKLPSGILAPPESSELMPDSDEQRRSETAYFANVANDPEQLLALARREDIQAAARETGADPGDVAKLALIQSYYTNALVDVPSGGRFSDDFRTSGYGGISSTIPTPRSTRSFRPSAKKPPRITCRPRRHDARRWRSNASRSRSLMSDFAATTPGPASVGISSVARPAPPF